MARQRLVVFGAGGFAREVAWLLSGYEHVRDYELLGYVQDGGDGQVLNGRPVMSWQSFCDLPRDTLVVVGVGSPSDRQDIVKRCVGAGFEFATLAHHNVEMSEFVELGVGSIICCGSILTVNIDIGQHVHVNLDCTIGHDVVVGDFTTLAPGVHVSGNVHIGKSVYIGTGASIINGSSESPLVVADGTVIGAGACVTRSTEPYCLYAGVPAELKKSYR